MSETYEFEINGGSDTFAAYKDYATEDLSYILADTSSSQPVKQADHKLEETFTQDISSNLESSKHRSQPTTADQSSQDDVSRSEKSQPAYLLPANGHPAKRSEEWNIEEMEVSTPGTVILNYPRICKMIEIQTS